MRPWMNFLLSTASVLIYSVVLFDQAITLNVALNSYNNALLTLLISNQSVEIKSSLFIGWSK